MNSKFYFCLFAILLIPVFASAQDTLYLVGIPGVDIGSDFNSYINALYKLSIAIAALLAVIKIIIAGLKWMLTDLITSKEDAKKDIQGAVLGLLIIIAAVIILETINPQLTKTQIFVAPGEDLDFSEVSQQQKAADCVLKYGSINVDTGVSPWASTTGTCNPSKATLDKYGGFVREYNCNPLGEVSSGLFNCDEVAAKCVSLGGVVEPYNAIRGASLDFKIACTPSSVAQQNCADKKGVWNKDTNKCSI